MKNWLPFLAVALLAAGCASSTQSQTHTTAPASHGPATSSHSAQNCVGGSNYGGIGASVSAFKAEHPTAGMPPPPSYQDGLAYFEIKATKHGCVSEYTITEATTPTQSARELLSLVDGIDIPNDARTHVLVNGNSCEVWSSASLKKATGKPYAAGFVEVVLTGGALPAGVDRSGRLFL